MRILTVLLCCFLMPWSSLAQRSHSGAAPDTTLTSIETGIIRLVNEHRASLSLPLLEEDSVLSSLARQHSRNMASGKVPFEHVGFDDRERAYQKIRKLRIIGAFAENIAEGPETAEDAVALWLTSEGHKRNIEGSFQYIGVGVARTKEGRLYFTQLFASR